MVPKQPSPDTLIYPTSHTQGCIRRAGGRRVDPATYVHREGEVVVCRVVVAARQRQPGDVVSCYFALGQHFLRGVEVMRLYYRAARVNA